MWHVGGLGGWGAGGLGLGLQHPGSARVPARAAQPCGGRQPPPRISPPAHPPAVLPQFSRTCTGPAAGMTPPPVYAETVPPVADVESPATSDTAPPAPVVADPAVIKTGPPSPEVVSLTQAAATDTSSRNRHKQPQQTQAAATDTGSRRHEGRRQDIVAASRPCMVYTPCLQCWVGCVCGVYIRRRARSKPQLPTGPRIGRANDEADAARGATDSFACGSEHDSNGVITTGQSWRNTSIRATWLNAERQAQLHGHGEDGVSSPTRADQDAARGSRGGGSSGQ